MAKKHILILTADTGHTSIAEAAKASLSEKYTVTIRNLSGNTFKLYSPFYRYFPQLFKFFHLLSQTKNTQKLIKAYIENEFRAPIESAIKKDKPDLVISTYYPFNLILDQLLDTYINFVTDPRTIHPLNLSAKAHNLVYDEIGAQICRKHHIDPDKIHVTGWWLRPQYSQTYNKAKVRQQLGIPKDELVFLIASGSEGTNWVMKIVPALLYPSKKVTAIFACGHNHNLYQTIETMKNVNQKIPATNNLTFYPLKFTHHLETYIQAADCVIGKAGPNLLFETIDTKTPFFAITHITGQEDGNLPLIKQKKLGFVEENIVKANKLLKRIIRQPQLLEKFADPIAKEAKHNRQATQKLSQLIDSILT